MRHIQNKEPAMPMPKPTLQTRCLRSAAALAMLVASAAARAHEGHGLEGSHWHATDMWGLLAIAAAAALYYHRRK
jgi:hypothetical protein